MRLFCKGVPFVVLLFCVFSPATRNGLAASASTELEKAKQTYDRVRKEIEDAYLADRINVPKNYLAALDRLEKGYQAKGDFEGVLAVQTEQKRFGEKRTFEIPKGDDRVEPKSLRNLRQRFVKTVESADKRRAIKLYGLTQKYLKHLESLKKSYTRAGKMDEAMEIQVEIQTITSADEFKHQEAVVEQTVQSTKSETAENRAASTTVGAGIKTAASLSPAASAMLDKLKAIIVPSMSNPAYYTYDIDRPINELVAHLWPQGIKVRVESSPAIRVRSVSYDSGGVPRYYAECPGMTSYSSSMRHGPRQLTGCTALEVLKRICAACSCGFAVSKEGVVLKAANAPDVAFSVMTIDANTLANAFREDFSAASEKYSGKKISIRGTIGTLGTSLGRKRYVTMGGNKIRVEFADDTTTKNGVDDLFKRHEQYKRYGGSSSGETVRRLGGSTSTSIRRLRAGATSTSNSRYQFTVAGVGKCKVVGLHVHITDTQLHGWNVDYR